MSEDNWKTPELQKEIVSEIDKTLAQYGIRCMGRTTDLENSMIKRAKTIEEYLKSVRKLLINLIELSSKYEKPPSSSDINTSRIL
ncbi:PREDICTED: mediator of RNA polymerase II transcription subunit 15-like [Nicrophorus vespilloides]|uniref:Mediator of RNA polymerase II transcription subunit 15 n=1 Tax=Nicrophorus vespilloides TaxID=110193 RepID=A0ABM1MVH9_NICVS|nr:PREDICTED: mediator of RNA polymerase II transcription subunit 15-like [Nicrophorus vespilloides]